MFAQDDSIELVTAMSIANFEHAPEQPDVPHARKRRRAEELATSAAVLPQDGLGDGSDPMARIPVIERTSTSRSTAEESLACSRADPEPQSDCRWQPNWLSEELWLAVDPGYVRGVPPQAVQALAACAWSGRRVVALLDGSCAGPRSSGPISTRPACLHCPFLEHVLVSRA